MTSVPSLSPTPFAAADPLLHPYFAGDETAAEERLETLVRDEALPIVRGVVGVRLGRDGRDLDDICNDIVLQVVRRLRAAREVGGHAPIASFRGYVATAAYRGCDAWLREKYPERYRLRNRVQYLVSHHPGFFLRAGEKRRWLCGLAKDIYSPDRTARMREVELRGIDWITEGSLKGEKLAATCQSLLESMHGAVDLEVLVSVLARGLDAPRSALAEHDVADERAHVGMTLEQQSHLRLLWNELRLLPRGQRVALLLNLRGADGEELMSLLPLVGIASIADIAEVLEISPQALAEIWNELPWSDHRIAELLGMTRQQVINLRKSGRERLLRRMRR
jgi:hypothetical protein